MLKQLSEPIPDSLQAKIDTSHKQRNLLPFFWILISVLASFIVYKFSSNKITSPEDILGSLLIVIASTFPLYLWCSGKVFGIPIFPIFAITYIWTTALPLISENKSIFVYDTSERFVASLTVTGFLMLGTVFWYQFVNKFSQSKNQFRVLEIGKGDKIFLGVLFIGNLYSIFTSANWFNLDGGVFSLVRAVILGLMAIAVFSMSYRFGSGKLSKTSSSLFLILLILNLITNSISLLLVGSMSLCLIAIVSYTIGRGKFPMKIAITAMLIFALLHSGKSDIRQLYWQQSIEPWQYPARYIEWIDYGINNLSVKEEDNNNDQSIIERASVFQQLLLTQSSTEKGMPLLDGYTYGFIPQLLLPRIFNPEKIASHEGTSVLNIYYGRQTRQDTLSTTIGWGLLAEAYANYGFIGCGLLAIFCGTFYGYISLLSMNAPVFSDRYLFAILVLNYAFQTEFTAGVYVAALFQSSITLLVFVVLLMKVKKLEDIET